MKPCICVLAILLTFGLISTTQADTASTQPALTSHEAAAKKLLIAMDMPDMMDKGLQQMVEVQIRQQPALAPFRSTMLDFLQKYVSWQNLEPDYIKLYADKFTEAELNQITAFYESPAGKKTIKALPELMTKGLQLAQQKVQAHGAELQQAIMKKAQETAGGTTQPSASSGPTSQPSKMPSDGEKKSD